MVCMITNNRVRQMSILCRKAADRIFPVVRTINVIEQYYFYGVLYCIFVFQWNLSVQQLRILAVNYLALVFIAIVEVVVAIKPIQLEMQSHSNW